jgi:outer membrane protein assembly factor BamB
MLLRSYDLNQAPDAIGKPATPRMDIQSSPAIGPDGTIYLSDFPGDIFALRDPGAGSTLELLWRFHPDTATPLHATPAIGRSGAVYLGFSSGTGASATSTLYAVVPPASGNQGQVYWSVDLGAGRMTSSPTIGPDDTIYVVTGPGKVVALSPDGKMKWTAQAGPTLRSTPALGPDGTVYVGSTDGKLYAVAPPAGGAGQGSVRWTFDFGQHLGSTPLVTADKGNGGANGIGTGASPTIGPDGTIYIGANNSNFYAIGPDGEQRWLFEAERELAGIWATAALSPNGSTLYFGANKGGMYAVTSADGRLVWQFNIYGSVYSSPLLDAKGNLYTGSTVGHVFGLSAADGRELFDFDAGYSVWTAPSLLPNGHLVVATRKGRVELLGDA